MKDEGDAKAGCLIFGLLFVLFWWVTSPTDDQVCRDKRIPVFDWLHDIDGQPTCQQMIDQLDAQAAQARSKEADLESRLAEVESRLNM